jgi:tetrahydromethanopterin S-methyltransferase subunit G
MGMIKDILQKMFEFFSGKVLKIRENEQRLTNIEKDVDLIKSQDEGRDSFSRSLYNIVGDLKVIRNDIDHIMRRLDKFEERFERRQIVLPVEFDRRGG